jgi:pyruvate carboxylase subunit B
VHDVAGFVALGKDLAKLGCDSIAIKDMAGLLTPYAAGELVKALKDAVDLPLHLHCHATSGLAEMCQLKAIEAGCRHIDTAISSWAGGTSHPPTESLVITLRGTAYDTGLDLDKLQAVNSYFAEVRKKYRRYESEFTGIDTQVHVFQVPGGMISNLANQLKERNALDRIAEVYKEIPLVRKDLGYPPLVTPTSQIVGTQAVLNVLTGKRYETITNEVKRYLQGGYGKTPAAVDSALQKRAIGKEEVIDCRPADLLKPEFDNLRHEIGELALTDEDVLSYAMFPEVGRLFLEQRSNNALVPEPLELESRAADAVKKAPTEFNVALHGESYHVKVTGAGPKNQTLRHFYFMVDGVPEDIVVETLDEIVLDGGTQGAVKSTISSKRAKPSAEGDVVVSMPCNILDVLVRVGQTVTAGQAVLITEAMKMETEVTAPIAGVVKAVHVIKGEPAKQDEVLIEIVPSS